MLSLLRTRGPALAAQPTSDHGCRPAEAEAVVPPRRHEAEPTAPSQKPTFIGRVLDTIRRNENRAVAAKAQILRGDISLQKKKYRDAVLDYLRTVTLFKSVDAVQAEALYKTANAMDQLRDPRAKDFYQQVVDGYGSSPYARRAQSKL